MTNQEALTIYILKIADMTNAINKRSLLCMMPKSLPIDISVEAVITDLVYLGMLDETLGILSLTELGQAELEGYITKYYKREYMLTKLNDICSLIYLYNYIWSLGTIKLQDLDARMMMIPSYYKSIDKLLDTNSVRKDKYGIISLDIFRAHISLKELLNTTKANPLLTLKEVLLS